MRKDKQIKVICEAIKQSEGIDYRYDHFRQKEAIPPPFLIYRRVAGAGFAADDKVYHKEGGVDLEVYASTPDEMASLMEKIPVSFSERDTLHQAVPPS